MLAYGKASPLAR